jgi:RHS repeat-associated protein
MKKSILAFSILWLCSQFILAQTTAQNFIKKTIPISAVTTEASLNALTSASKVESINYIDGLGRTLQDVLIKGSPIGNDIIQPYYYDQYGRQSIQLLPYIDPALSGTYRDQAYDAQPVFYTNQTKVAKTTSPSSQMVFDGSPLNQVIEKSAPDTDWQLGNGHTTKVVNSTNGDYDVFQWEILANGDVQPVEDIVYNSNSLSSSKLTDPNGNYSYIYTNKSGKTICTKQFLEMRGQEAYYLTTYMVYDDFGQLVMVIPPKAMDVMDASGNYSINALTQDLVFKYKYDERHRLIEKKVPGIGWSYIVYNQLNQPVLFQDANLQAQNKWSFIKYDVLGRPIMSGLFNSTGLANYQTRALAQTQFNANQTAIGESEILLDGSNPYGYTNLTLPNTALDILTVNYYDDYDFDNNGTPDYTFNASSIPCLKVVDGSQGFCTPYTNAVTNRTRGYLTGSRVKVLDAANPVQWEIASVFYDDNGQAIQSQSNDHMGGTDLINMVYDFVGNVIHTQQLHTLSTQSVQVINHMYFDKMGRLIRVEQKNNSDAAIILAAYSYNELSQVIEKNVHRVSVKFNAAGFLQSMDYRYNIHGGLTSINNIDLSSDMASLPLTGTNDDTNDLWGMQLNYNTNTTGVSGTKQYAGNVSEKKWRSITDNIKRAYGYDYDKADRLKSSLYAEYGAAWVGNTKYDEKDITYDANGNITALKRYGCQTSGSSFGLIDNLTYQYNGNFLGSVNDASATQGYLADFKDNGSIGANEYTYDTNGNLTANPNKKITGISYNHLNLPTQINFSTGPNDKIEYTYDATGTRLRKKTTQTVLGVTTITLKNYASIFEYIDNSGTTVLESFHTSEGRCVLSTTTTPQFRYEYQYTDNTGNVVMAFSDMDFNNVINTATEIIQQSHYYAFGMRMEGTNVLQVGVESKYKFSGKEFNDELGLNEYDFGARFYDPAIARWGCVDPMADAAPNWTPFRYGFNNPITVTDPTGMLEGDFNWDGRPDDPDSDGDKPKWVEKYDEKQGKIVGQWVYDKSSGGSSSTGGSGSSSSGSSSSGSSSSGGSVSNNNTATAGNSGTFILNTSFGSGSNDNSGGCSNSCGGITPTQALDAIGNAISAITPPASVDLTVGATEYKLGLILANRLVTKAPWEDLPIKRITTIIKTPLGNVHAPTSSLITISKVFKGLGAVTGGIGVISSIKQYADAGNNQEKNEAVVDGVIGLIGFVPGGGWAVSGAYFLIVKPMFKASSINLIPRPSIRPIQDNTIVSPKFNFRR